MIWFLVGYMWLFIHRPFEIWPELGNLYIERVYMILTIVYWALFAPKSWTSNRATWGIAAIAAAIILATIFSAHTNFDNGDVQDWLKLLAFYFLVIFSVREERELRILIVAFVVIMAVYQLHSLREYLCGRGQFDMGIWRMAGVDRTMGDANSFAASVNYAIPMLLPVLTVAEKQWQRLALAAALCLACLCVLLSGSRTGFMGILLLACAAGLASRHRKRLMLLVMLAAPIIWFSLSERLQNRYLTLVDPSVGPRNAEASAESRQVFFWMAVDIWKQHPAFGVGPGCFSVVSGTHMQSHTLYAQTISELGTAGVFALMALTGCYIANFIEARRLYRESARDRGAAFCYRVVIAATIGLAQLLFFGFGGHNLFRSTWIWYAAFAALSLRFLKEHHDFFLAGEQQNAFESSAATTGCPGN